MKTLITTIVMVFAFAACGGESNEKISLDEMSARVAWEEMLTESEKAILCDIYFSVEKEEIIDYLVSEPDPISVGEAEGFYVVMNEEC